MVLDSNQIKFLNGEAFHNLIKLKRTTINSNPCINEDFEDESRILTMSQVVKNSCGFCEKIVDITNCELLKEIKPINEENMKNVEKIVMKIHEDQRILQNSTNSLKIIAVENENLKMENSSVNALAEVEKNDVESEKKFKQENLSSNDENQKIDEKILKNAKSSCEFLENDFEDRKRNSRNIEAKEKEDFQKMLEEKIADNLRLTVMVANLESQLRASKDEIQLKEEFHKKLDIQKSEIFTERIQDLSKENENLKSQIQFLNKQKLC